MISRNPVSSLAHNAQLDSKAGPATLHRRQHQQLPHKQKHEKEKEEKEKPWFKKSLASRNFGD